LIVMATNHVADAPAAATARMSVPAGLHALAMVPPASEMRVHAAICPPGILSVRLVPEQFVDSVERGWPDVAVVDPVLTRGIGRIPAVLRATHTPAVLYVPLTPEHAQAAVEFLRLLPVPVITFGYADDARALAAALLRSGRATRGGLLLDRLAPALARLPQHIARGITQANESHRRVPTTAELAAYCGVHRATLAQAFAQARLWPASRLVAALGLVQEYDALGSATVPLLGVARRLGLNSTRALASRCETISGFSPATIRRGLPFESFCAACAGRLSRAVGVEPAEAPGDAVSGAPA
jgi:AraC-like DNA-binding protein